MPPSPPPAIALIATLGACSTTPESAPEPKTTATAEPTAPTQTPAPTPAPPASETPAPAPAAPPPPAPPPARAPRPTRPRHRPPPRPRHRPHHGPGGTAAAAAPAPAQPATPAVYYPNCDAAKRAARAAHRPHIGDPGYSTKLDRDRDGARPAQADFRSGSTPQCYPRDRADAARRRTSQPDGSMHSLTLLLAQRGEARRVKPSRAVQARRRRQRVRPSPMRLSPHKSSTCRNLLLLSLICDGRGFQVRPTTPAPTPLPERGRLAATVSTTLANVHIRGDAAGSDNPLTPTSHIDL